MESHRREAKWNSAFTARRLQLKYQPDIQNSNYHFIVYFKSARHRAPCDVENLNYLLWYMSKLLNLSGHQFRHLQRMGKMKVLTVQVSHEALLRT